MSKSKNSGISINEWLQAEAKCRAIYVEPKPEGLTTDEFAAMMEISPTTASSRLLKLVRAGIATRTTWKNGRLSKFVYNLNGKKPK